MIQTFKSSKFFLATIIVVGLAFGAFFFLTPQQKKIMVVHSYYKDLPWVNDIDEGIHRATQQNTNITPDDLEIRYHYMNLKNNPDCLSYANAASHVRMAMDQWEPDIVLLFDDLAQALVGFNQLVTKEGFAREQKATEIAHWLSQDRCEDKSAEFFDLLNPNTSNPPEIIFAGVNGTSHRYGYPEALNVSGIYEHKNYRALEETLSMLQDSVGIEKNLIQFLNDDSPTATSELTYFKQYQWKQFTALPPANVKTFEQWKVEVEKANKTGAMLLIGNYQNLVNESGNTIAPRTIIRWTESHSTLPVLGANTNFISDGGMMTVATSGTEQGEAAMKMALSSFKDIKERNVKEPELFTIGMNKHLIDKRGLKLPGIYEAYSRETGTFIGISNGFSVNQDLKRTP